MTGLMTTTPPFPAFNLGSDLCVQGTEMQINGCGTEYGIWL